MNLNSKLVIATALALLTAGCMRTSYTRSYVSSLPATPVQQVEGGQLDPVDPNAQPVDQSALGGQGSDQGGTTVIAANSATAGTGAVGRSELLGGWNVSSGASSCKLFMTLTTWSGGYRANTRGCDDGNLSRIAAWNLNGNTVVLKDASGGDIATLSGGGATFSGQTSSGEPISFQR
ncbi:AprI/Inh family metalloprotease inhibitor [Polycladidibacter hongkongensis]|uniref:AprI/Inh family metalloprotease inhibitor n=1 Tax=Polycladidibacter hongkongensis TaxID=1647556 RepID=UPI0008347F85|nr:AprI/Inh family metalloprotease inhibitor [Pseudovibrio hongkongensis]